MCGFGNIGAQRACCSAGGVKMISGSQRITLDNTLDERLRLLEDRVSTLAMKLTARDD